MRSQFEKEGHCPIEFVTGRVKPVASIKEKMVRRQIREERLADDMEDIAGIRIMCQFVEDIYTVVDIIGKRSDMQSATILRIKSRAVIDRIISSFVIRYSCLMSRQTLKLRFK